MAKAAVNIDHQNDEGLMKPVKMSVKVDRSRFERLKIFGLKSNQSSQDIFIKALDKFLEAEDTARAS